MNVTILTPEEEEQLKLIKLNRSNNIPQRVKETITPEEYQKRLNESLKRDKHVYAAAKQERIEKASKEWRKKVGPRFAEAHTENPTILDRVRRLEQNTGVHKTSIVLSGNLGVGKAQPLTEKILTPTGWKPMGRIKQGDMVITSSGKSTLVRKTHPVLKRITYKIWFDDGTFVKADGEHLWLTYVGYNKTKTLTTHEINETLHEKHKIPTLSPIEIPGQLTIDSGIETIINETWGTAKPLSQHVEMLPHLKKMKKQLNIKKKTRDEPTWVLGLTPETREKFIRTVFTLFGTMVDKHTVEITIPNDALLEEITHMVRSNGGWVKQDNDANRLTVRTSFNIFDETDKKYRLYSPLPKKETVKTVTDVTTDGFVKVRCLTVAATNHTYVTTGYTVTHNTWLGYAYINQAVQSGAVTPGQIVADTETAILGKISSSGFRRAELLEELFHPKYKIYFIDDVGQGYFSSEQSRKEVWYELLDHVYSHDLTLILTTNKEFVHQNGKIVGSPALERWIGSAAYDRLRHIVGGDGLIIPGNVNKRPSVYENREENLKKGK